MRGDYIYAIELPNGQIKFGLTRMLRDRFMANRCKYGLGTKPLGIAVGTYGHETELRRFLDAYRVEGEREIFHPAPLVKRVILMMAPYPPVPPPSQRLKNKFARVTSSVARRRAG